MILLYGAGGHASVILDTLNDLGFQVRGIFDDAPKNDIFFGTPVLGKYDAHIFKDDLMVVTIGNNATRKRVSSRVKHAYGSIKARTSLFSASAKVGDGSMILQNTIVQAYSTIGEHVILNTGCQVDHDCTVEDYAHIAPGVVLCGEVKIGEGTLVGAGAVIIPGVKIGKWCTIGAGSVVLKDVPDGSVFAGNPAHQIKVSNK